jgi:hypothetical protein
MLNLFEIGVACDDGGFFSLSCGDCEGIGVRDRVSGFDGCGLNDFLQGIADSNDGQAGQDSAQEIFCFIKTTLSCEDVESFADVNIVHHDSDLIRGKDTLHFLRAFFAF